MTQSRVNSLITAGTSLVRRAPLPECSWCVMTRGRWCAAPTHSAALTGRTHIHWNPDLRFHWMLVRSGSSAEMLNLPTNRDMQRNNRFIGLSKIVLDAEIRALMIGQNHISVGVI